MRQAAQALRQGQYVGACLPPLEERAILSHAAMRVEPLLRLGQGLSVDPAAFIQGRVTAVLDPEAGPALFTFSRE